MFYAVLALMQTVGKTSSKHAGVIGLFDSEFVLKGLFSRELSRDFRRAFEARQISDYQPLDPSTTEQAQEFVVKAQCFVTQIEAHLKQHYPI